jgi:group I intron endonuclease
MQGIYVITNPEGKQYIGLSKDIETRWKSYKSYTGISKNSSIKLSLKKYGFENHKFEVLEEVEGDGKYLRERERYWIDKFNTLNEGLNDNRGGCGTNTHTAKSKRKISEKLKGKPKPKDFGANRKKWQHTEEWKNKLKNAPRCPVIVESLDGKVVKEFGNQALAAEWIGVSRPVIQLILRKKPQSNGKIPTLTKGFKISYK